MGGNVDGYVVVEARVTSDKFKGDIDKLTKELYKYEKESQKIMRQKAQLEIDTTKSESNIQKIENQLDILDKQIQHMQESNLPERLVDNIDYQKLLSKRDELAAKEDIELLKLDDIKNKQQEVNDKAQDNLRIRELITNEINKAGGGLKNFDGISNQVDKTSHKIFKKMTKWGLAIVGVKTAYMGIRRIMNSVLSSNKELSDQYSAMGQSFANAFAPLVKKIINLFKTLMAYANVIWKALFGKELFKSVVDSTDKTKKNLGSSAKSAKEINKQLAAFDEANVLTKPSDSSGGGGAGSTDTGKIDLGLDKVKIPKWLDDLRKWIEKHPKLAKIIFGLAPFVIFGMASLVKAGISAGIAKLLGHAGAGAAATGATGLLGVLGTCLLLAGTVIAVYFAAKGINELLDAYADLYASQNRVAGMIEDENKVLDKQSKQFIADAEAGKKTNQEMNTYTSHLRNVIKETKYQIDSNVLNKDAQKAANEEIKKAATAYKELYDKGLLTADQEYEYYKFLLNDYVPGLDLSSEHGQAMAEVLEQMSGTYEIRFRTDKIKELKDIIEQTGDKLSGLVNNANFKKWIGGNANITKAIEYLKQQGVLKYAEGGIVNMPGRGVPIAIGGEAGREGVIPMDNESQMQLLGQSIAKYVRIDNYVNNYMDARKINTLLQQSANRERLANNG